MSADMEKSTGPGTLYLVGTPIGNLEDISARALRILREADFIAAEDTRVSLKLLNHFGIKKPLVSCHAHNETERGARIAARLASGESCALVTDAGMPCISDPGGKLVELCAERGIPVTSIPGPSAAIMAVALSGLDSGRFAFEGFLSTGRSAREKHLEELRDECRTLVFYEAPHKLPGTLADLLRVLGERKITLARELTKLHEEVWRTTLSRAAEHYAENAARGEFVLVIEGAKRDGASRQTVPWEEAVRETARLRDAGMSLSKAAGEAARLTGYRKSELYRAVVEKDQASRQ